MKNREKQSKTDGLHNIHSSKKRKNNLRKRWGILGLLALIGLLAFVSQEKTSASTLQKGIASKILRFHVIANSDSEEDQALKLEVKDAVVEYMKEILGDAENIEDTRRIVTEHTGEIKQIAQNYVAARGYDYPVEVFIDHRFFPVKTYGTYTFPAGEYEAICVELGDHSGKNWWCVMYPSLCFVDAVHAVVPEETDKELRQILTEEEYQAISQGEAKVKFSFKFLEWF